MPGLEEDGRIQVARLVRARVGFWWSFLVSVNALTIYEGRLDLRGMRNQVAVYLVNMLGGITGAEALKDLEKFQAILVYA